MIFDDGRILFVDLEAIESLENTQLVLNPPVKKGPSLFITEPWEQNGARGSSIIEWQGLYRLYYKVTPSIDQVYLAFVTSRDGIEWERPNLATVEFEGGCANNLVDIDGQKPNETCVFVDPTGPDEHRFKLVCHNQHEGGMYLLTSPDGIRFKRHDGFLLHFITDNHMSAFYDPRTRCYRIYLRSLDKSRPHEPVRGSRMLSLAETGDLFQPVPIREDAPDPWPVSPKFQAPEHEHTGLRKINRELPIAIRADEADPPPAGIYQGAVVQYLPETYLAFPSLYYKHPWPPKGFINDGILDIQFATSRDGRLWSRHLRGPYVNLDLPDGPCSRMIHMLVGMVPFGRRISQYYVGRNRSHGQGRLPDRPKPVPEVRLGDPILHRLEQRVDGFVSADSSYTGGSLVTRPFRITSDRLRINVNTSASGVARAALLDEESAEIPGFTLEQCDPIQGNDTAYTLQWQGNPSVSSLKGRGAKLLVDSRSTKLFAVYPGGEGHPQ
jgi:hypothetical protein